MVATMGYAIEGVVSKKNNRDGIALQQCALAIVRMAQLGQNASP
jgi:hypothetical protein